MSRLKNLPKKEIIEKLDKMNKTWLVNVDRRTKHILIQAKDIIEETIREEEETTNDKITKNT